MRTEMVCLVLLAFVACGGEDQPDGGRQQNTECRDPNDTTAARAGLPPCASDPAPVCQITTSATRLQCTATLYPDGSSGEPVRVRHDVYQLPDGRVFSSCMVMGDPKKGRADAWAAAVDGPCAVDGNLLAPTAPYGVWTFELNAVGSASFVTYWDAGSRYSGFNAAVACF